MPTQMDRNYRNIDNDLEIKWNERTVGKLKQKKIPGVTGALGL